MLCFGVWCGDLNADLIVKHICVSRDGMQKHHNSVFILDVFITPIDKLDRLCLVTSLCLGDLLMDVLSQLEISHTLYQQLFAISTGWELKFIDDTLGFEICSMIDGIWTVKDTDKNNILMGFYSVESLANIKKLEATLYSLLEL